MLDKELKKLGAELDDWRGRFDRLRVQANLGKKELRDKLNELDGEIDPVYQRAKKRLAELARSGADQAEVLTRSVQAGWDQLRRTHRDLSRDLQKERSK